MRKSTSGWLRDRIPGPWATGGAPKAKHLPNPADRVEWRREGSPAGFKQISTLGHRPGAVAAVTGDADHSVPAGSRPAAPALVLYGCATLQPASAPCGLAGRKHAAPGERGGPLPVYAAGAGGLHHARRAPAHVCPACHSSVLAGGRLHSAATPQAGAEGRLRGTASAARAAGIRPPRSLTARS